MRVGVLFSIDQLGLLIEKNIDLLIITPASDFDEFDVKEKTDISCVNLSDYLEKGEISPLSRTTARFIRHLMQSVEGPVEALSSQNDLYQYHFRGQYLFLVALERFLIDRSNSVLIFPLKNTARFYSPMRPDVGLLYNPKRTLVFLASEIAQVMQVQVEFLSSPLPGWINYVLDHSLLFFRRKITGSFTLIKLLQKVIRSSLKRVKNNRFLDLEAFSDDKKIGIIVRTDSEVISAHSLIKYFDSSGSKYVVIQDEILSSTTTVSRLESLNIKYMPIGHMLGFRGLLKALCNNKKLDLNNSSSRFADFSTSAEKVLFTDINIEREIRERLLDFYVPQRHFSLELKQMVKSFGISKLITFAYVDQWGGIVKDVGDQFGLPTLAIQNAAQDPEEYPKLCWADHYCVESLYLKKRLVSLDYPVNKITGTGLPHYTAGTSGIMLSREGAASKQIVILTQPIYERYYCQLIEQISVFCSKHNYCLAIKYHPRQAGTEYSQVIENASKVCEIKVYKSESLDEIIKKSRLVLSVVSAAILRALNLGVPTVSFLPKSEKYLDLYYTDQENLFVVSDSAGLDKLLNRLVNDYETLLNEFEIKLNNYNSEHCLFESSQDPLFNVINIIDKYRKPCVSELTAGELE